MKEIILYHGSNNIIKKPIYGEDKIYKDYGKGFYCTKNIELAKEWANYDNQSTGFLNKYSLNLSKLKILDLTNKKYSILNWMEVLLENREFNITSEIARKGKKFLMDNYLIDLNEYDIVIGYRGDDSYFHFAKDFLNNTIPIQKLEKAMELDINKQIVLVSKKAFDEIKFIGFEQVDKIHYIKRVARDISLREKYNNISLENGKKDIYLRDLINGEKYER